MATDNSPPRVRVILITMAASLFVLVGLKFILDSYYLSMMEGELFEKVGSVPATELNKLHANEKRNLTTSKVPIDRAMKELGTRGREGDFKTLASVDIEPQASQDTGPLVGWVKLAKTLPESMTAANDGGAAPMVPTVVSDGGVAMMSDAAVVPVVAVTGDGGAGAAVVNAADAGHKLIVPILRNVDAGGKP